MPAGRKLFGCHYALSMLIICRPLKLLKSYFNSYHRNTIGLYFLNFVQNDNNAMLMVLCGFPSFQLQQLLTTPPENM